MYTDMCLELVSLGFDVTVRCAYPYYPEWKDKSGNNGIRIERTELKGVKIERHGLFLPKDPSKFSTRLVHEASYLLSLLRTSLKRDKYDVIIAYCPSFASVVVGSVVKALTGAKMWLNVQDIPADAASNIGLNKSSFIKTMMDGVQKFFFNKADVWSTISPVMRNRLDETIKPEIPNLLVCNWLNRSMQESIDNDEMVVDEGRHEGIKLLYAGNIGVKQGILQLCKALHESKADFDFAIFGDGAEAANVSRWVQQSGDTRFRFSGFLPEAGFVNQIKQADIFVITEKDGAGSSFIPSKMIPSISAGTPILALCDKEGPLGSEVTDFQLGPHYEWANIDKLLGDISDSQHTPEQIKQWSDNCIKRSSVYGRKENIARIAELLQVMSDKSMSLSERSEKVAALDV